MSEHRLTITITPISEEELQAFIDDFRERFGRKHLVHVIGKQPSGTHLSAAPAVEPEGVDVAGEQCGAWGGCVLPAGHNRGRADIPARHESVGMDVEAQGEMADELTAARAAIQRVRELCLPAIGGPLLNRALFARDILRALDGDTTEEQR